MQFKEDQNPIIFRSQEEREHKQLERDLEELIAYYEEIEAEKPEDDSE